MTNLIAAAAFFLLLHLLVSGTRLRGALVGMIGEGPFMGLFSLASVAGLAWMIFAFGQARASGDNLAYWSVEPALRHVQYALQFLAVMLIVPGLTTPNPTSVKQEGVLDRPDPARGVVRITRHPFLWGVALWASGHLLVNGERASLILFGTLLMLALLGTVSIDAKRRRAQGPVWDAFAAKTSNIPFAAILSGRQSLRLGEIGLWRIALAVGVYFALLFGHPYVAGVAALG